MAKQANYLQQQYANVGHYITLHYITHNIEPKLFSVLSFYRSLNVDVCSKPTFTDTTVHLILDTLWNTNLKATVFL
jgi:hypothetical protein